MVMAMQEAHFVSWGPPSAQDMELVWLRHFMRGQKKQITDLFSKSLCIRMRISSLTRKLHSKRNVLIHSFHLKQGKRYRIRMPLDETGVEFDEGKIDRIVSDVRDEAHLNARRATQSKYE